MVSLSCAPTEDPETRLSANRFSLFISRSSTTSNMRRLLLVSIGVWFLCRRAVSASLHQCNETFHITRIASKSETYRCGWWGWLKCKRTRYYTSYDTIYLCCKGYEKVDGECISTTKSVAAVSASLHQCNETFHITRIASKSETYRCGWWGWLKCKRTRYYTSYDTIYLCCKGYEKVDGKCISTTKSVACGRPTYQSDISPFIVGGTEAYYGEYPWMVSLIAEDHFCAGTIIDDRWILTAAHCLVDRLFGEIRTDYKIRIGEHDRRVKDVSDREYTTEAQFIHESYSRRTNVNDIALIKTAEQIRYDDHVKPICLPNVGQKCAVGTDMEIAGWGRTATDGPSADILQKARVQQGDIADCIDAYGTSINETRQLCIKDGHGNIQRAACKGDSGGPLMLRDCDVITCVGITSFGIQNGCATGYPVVYTAVSEYVTWIKSTMREN